MLKYQLTHPTILEAVAGAGHGSKILIADGHYPFSTGKNPLAPVVYLNLSPGMVRADEVLNVLLSAIHVESATLMTPGNQARIEAHEEYRLSLGAEVPIDLLDRFSFYSAARTQDVALVIATGDTRHYANILLTIGVR